MYFVDTSNWYLYHESYCYLPILIPIYWPNSNVHLNFVDVKHETHEALLPFCSLFVSIIYSS